MYSGASASESNAGVDGDDHHLPLQNCAVEPSETADNGDSAVPNTIDQHFETANESREVLKRREFVRARKARAWITDQKMTSGLVQVIVGTQANEAHLHLMLREHSQDTWNGQGGLQQVPLVRLAQPGKSPVSHSLDIYSRMQTTPVDILLEVVESMPSFDKHQEERSMFEMLVEMSSCIWRKLHAKILDVSMEIGSDPGQRLPTTNED